MRRVEAMEDQLRALEQKLEAESKHNKEFQEAMMKMMQDLGDKINKNDADSTKVGLKASESPPISEDSGGSFHPRVKGYVPMMRIRSTIGLQTEQEFDFES